MTVGEKLTQFYKENGILEEGGINDKIFTMAVFAIILTLPNLEFRNIFYLVF